MPNNKKCRLRQRKSVAVVDNCIDCGQVLPKKSVHHVRCVKCWESRQLSKGNLALIGGIK